MGFFAPWSALLLLVVPPLVALYFLKLKRPRVEVPSLVLWRQVLDDARVNSPFQRFKRHLLLWLQLLILALLILAAMQPYWRGDAYEGDNLPVLIDTSASMAALTGPGGKSRLDDAKARVAQLIDGLQGEQRLCLIAFGDTPRKLTPFTDNKRVLREALADLEPEAVTSDLEGVLRITQGLGQRTQFTRAMLYTDGNVPGRVDFPLGFELMFQRVDPPGPNVAITALSARRSSAEVEGAATAWDVLVTLEAADSTAAMPVTLVVAVEGEDAPRERVVAVTPGQAEQVLFPIRVERESSIEVRIRPEVFDSLSIDNAASLRLDPARRLRVYASGSLAAYRAVMKALPEVDLNPDPTKPATAGYDLIVSDREGDFNAPAPVTFRVGLMPGETKELLVRDEAGTQVIDWQRDDPLLTHVDLRELVVVDDVRMAERAAGEGGEGGGGGVVRMTDLESLGFEPMVYGQHGPLLLRHREGASLDYWLLFHSNRSTLNFRVGFPILVQNLVQVSMQVAGLLEQRADSTGVLRPIVGLVPSTTYDVAGPGGLDMEAQTDEAGVLAGVPAPRAGAYRVEGPRAENVVRYASLLSPFESSLESVDAIALRDVTVAAGAVDAKADRPLWHWLALAALAVLLVEWWAFQKRGRPRYGAG